VSERAIGKERRAREERERVRKLEQHKFDVQNGGREIATVSFSDDREAALTTARKLDFDLVLRRNYNGTGWRILAVRA
jgi:hypothetical protein